MASNGVTLKTRCGTDLVEGDSQDDTKTPIENGVLACAEIIENLQTHGGCPDKVALYQAMKAKLEA
jgi:hypothetical protein